MTKTFSQKMQELKRVVKLHANWLVYATLGESAVTKSEVAELKQYGKLPMDETLDLTDKSYLLGKFRALLKRDEYSGIAYDQVNAKTFPLTPLEELVVEQARLRAGQGLKGVSQEIADGTYGLLSQVLGKAVSEAVVSQTVSDETALAVIYRKTAQELAASLAQRLQTSHKRNWLLVAQTALHGAKVAGAAQAIVNKVGIYALSDGPDSFVSVVPGRACCADCTAHYTGPDGQPRLFRLATLLGAGSNADGDVTHSKTNGKHTGWKTTLPPLHPSCGCNVVYVPPGHGWVNGKLSMINKSLFAEHLAKSRSGVSGGISPTVEPKGAPANAKEPGMGSQPGAAAPTNAPGPGRPSGGLPKPGSGTPGGAGGGPQYVACPFGGGADCMKHGGNGAAMHKPGGAIMQKHQEAMMAGAKPTTPEAIDAQHKAMDATAVAYNGTPHPRDVTLNHLSEGDIGSAKNLSSEGLAGNHVSHKVTIVGNGSGVMKPAPAFPEEIYKGAGWADGAANIPKNSGHKSEVGASNLAHSMGLTEHVPPTVARAGAGEHGIPTGPTSVQQWQDGYVASDMASYGVGKTEMGSGSGSEEKSTSGNHYDHLRNAAQDKDVFDKKMSEIAVLDIAMNNNDRHFGNLVVNSDHSDIKGIDHGLSFGSGMQGHKNGIHYGMEKAGKPLQVPDHLMTRFKTSSLGQTERALEGSGLQPWQVMQTHLRQKYVAHLQETHGYIPPETTRYALQGCGKKALPRPGKGFGEPGDEMMDRVMAYNDLEQKGQTPDALFASFAKDHIQKGLAKKDSPEHADYVKMSEAMPLHKPGRAFEEDYNGSEDHKDYWDSIKPYKGVECESFQSRYNKKPTEAPAPLRTPPTMAEANTAVPTSAPTSDVDIKTVKPAKRMNKGLWIDPHLVFPLDKIGK